ncbi:roundabout homolog 2-like [Gadus macrocephalus]|uniref:roundabout homolog 2-like n=1 Tax=Gadus macrocephalus TaxID=80720 RepID=UPI0028CBA6C4|nr:roundabout homolog 2-like [Gadus macrocephalus]
MMDVHPGIILLLISSSVSVASGSRSRFEDSPPRIVENPSDLVVSKGEPATLNCKAEGRPGPLIEWYKDGERVETDRDDPRSHRMLLPSGSLFFLRIVHGRRSKPDEGVYTCVARNHLGEAISRNASLEVASNAVWCLQSEAPRPEQTPDCQQHGVPPQISIKPRDQIAAQGKSATFQCGTTGNPPPAIFWQKEGSQMLLFPGQPPSQSGRYSVSMGGQLGIADVHPEDAGFYICQAISVAGSVLTKALLEVEGGPSGHIPPIIRQGPANQTVSRGTAAQLHCHVIGGSSVRISWEKDGEGVEGDKPRTTLMENGTLQITDVKETDSGMYTCTVSSTKGESSWSGMLTVREDASMSRVSESIQLPGPPQKPVVTEVTRNTVTLTWQSNPHEGGAAVTSYIIEAFSQSVGSAWQTVADHVKQERHTVLGLFPNTVYLFIVRAVNSYGLSDPSPISEPVRTQDGSPTEQGVDHRQVQKELGQVSVYMLKPVVLSPSSAKISWTVARQSRYVQGYRVFYRTIGSSWLVQDVESAPEQSTILAELRGNTEYEVKIRPYFNELQGVDSLMVGLRTPEEVLCVPPQAVSVVQLSNSSSINVSWEPPPHSTLTGIIHEYRVWCLGASERGGQMNRTVDGAVLSILLTGLLPGVRYSVMVASVTALGEGPPSPPVDLLLSAPGSDRTSVPGETERAGPGLGEQITGVVRQPAFMAGLGVASWVVLMGFSGWLYCRHRRRKQLGHYTTSFAYTPAVGFPHGEGSGIINGGPGMLGSNMGTYPWLAESWHASNLSQQSKESVYPCSSKLGPPDRYFTGGGLHNFPSAQSEKYSSKSSDSPIYSTINTAAEEDLLTYYDTYSSVPYSLGPDPYASSPVLTHSSLAGLEQGLDQWTIQAGQSGAEYAKLQYSRTTSAKKVKQRSSRPSKPATLNWVDVLSQPLPADRDLGQGQMNPQDCLSTDEDEEDWCPPLPARTYLMDEELALSLQQSAASPSPSLSPSPSPSPPSPLPPQRRRTGDHPPRQRPLDLLAAHHPSSSSAGTATNASVTQSNPDLFSPKEVPAVGELYHTLRWPGDAEGAADAGKEFNPAVQAHKSRPKKKPPRDGQQQPRREVHTQADLPPPPTPPPTERSDAAGGGGGGRATEGERAAASGSPAAQRRRGLVSPQKRGPSKWLAQDENVILYGQSCALPKVQSSSYGSLGGAPVRPATSPRAPGSAEKRRDEPVAMAP